MAAGKYGSGLSVTPTGGPSTAIYACSILLEGQVLSERSPNDHQPTLTFDNFLVPVGCETANWYPDWE